MDLSRKQVWNSLLTLSTRIGIRMNQMHLLKSAQSPLCKFLKIEFSTFKKVKIPGGNRREIINFLKENRIYASLPVTDHHSKGGVHWGGPKGGVKITIRDSRFDTIRVESRRFVPNRDGSCRIETVRAESCTNRAESRRIVPNRAES